MASNMKAVKLRMKSIQSTMQITKAMELVAASKLRKAKERADNTKRGFNLMHEALSNIAAGNIDFTSVYSKENASEKYCYIVIAGDRGLAGGYNSNLFKFVDAQAKDKDYCVLPLGKKALEYYSKKGTQIITDHFGEVEEIGIGECFDIARIVCNEYKANTFGHAILCYTDFKNMLVQESNAMPILPLSDFAVNGSDKTKVRNLIEYKPDPESVFDAIVPEYITNLVYGGVCSSFASELAARRTAMEAATKNAGEMIDQLELYYNRARQASITQEITEIVAGADS